jgi:glycosyltransferase involved in cell wall biosynthesis
MTPIDSVHVLGSRELGGADRFFIRLVEALARGGHPTLAVTRRGSPVAREMDAGIAQAHLPLASKWDVYSRWRLTGWLERRRPDIVQTYMGRATRLTRLPRGSRTVHVARLGGYYKIAGYYEHAHAWVGNTKGICDHLRRNGLPTDRIFHIGNFVPQPRPVGDDELPRLYGTLSLPADAFMVFALGRMVAKKGFDDLLRAFAKLPSHAGGRPLVLVIAGDGPQKGELHQLAGSLGLGTRIRWAGWQNDPTPFYALADAFVCPSRHEPLGNVILEAWQHRLPIVTTRNEGASELVEDGRNALVVDVSSPENLSRGLWRLVEMPDGDRRALGEAGYETVRREHSEQAVVGSYIDLYRRLTGQRHA